MIEDSHVRNFLMSYSFWSEEEDEILRNCWKNVSRKELQNFIPKHSWQALTHRAGKLKLGKRIPNAWGEKEDVILSNMWVSSTLIDIKKALPQRSLSAIKARAVVLGLKRDARVRLSSTEILLNDSIESSYWVGFLLADGYVNGDKVYLGLAIKDFDHLKRYADYIGYKGIIKKSVNGNSIRVTVSCSNRKTSKKLQEKYGFSSKKTWNPPDPEIFDELSDDNFIALVLGFIDGDGCITVPPKKNTSIICITSHGNWSTVFNYIAQRLSEIWNIKKPPRAYCRKFPSSNGEIARLTFGRAEWVRSLKLHGERLKLPLLARKWNKIDMDRGKA